MRRVVILFGGLAAGAMLALSLSVIASPNPLIVAPIDSYINSAGVSSGPINMNNNYISGVSQIRMQDTGLICYGASCAANNTRMYSSVVLDQATWGLGSEHGRQMLFVEANNVSNDYGVATPTNPTVRFYSSTAAASATDEWIGIYDDTANGVIDTGKGAIHLQPFEPVILIGASKALTDATVVDFVRVSVAQGGHAHGTIWFSVFVAESGDTDLQALQGMATFSAVNEGGTVACDVVEGFGTDSYAESDAASTLTVSFACVEDVADTIDISINANTSFAATTSLELEWSLQTAEDYGATAL